MFNGAAQQPVVAGLRHLTRKCLRLPAGRSCAQSCLVEFGCREIFSIVRITLRKGR